MDQTDYEHEFWMVIGNSFTQREADWLEESNLQRAGMYLTGQIILWMRGDLS